MLEFLYGLGWLVVICGSGYGLWWFRFGRYERAARLEPIEGMPGWTRSTVHSKNLPPPSFNSPAPGAEHTAPTPQTNSGSATLFTSTPPEVRQHTAIGARPGDGKTQTDISLMIQDMLSGGDVYWLNPQYTYHHPKDQPINLHPVKHLFTAVDDYQTILAILDAAYAEGVRRKPLYQAGKDVGHNICLHLDEWPAIYAELGDVVAEKLQRILRECRKLNIWANVGSQDFLVETTGFNSGVRAAFTTKLVGNVDDTTWRTLLGTGQKKQPVLKGTWMTDTGWVDVVRPTADLIARVAPTAARPYVGSLLKLSTVSDAKQPDPIKEEKVTDTDVARLLLFLDTPADAETNAEKGAKLLKAAYGLETIVSPGPAPQNDDSAPFRNVDFDLLARLTRGTKLTETEALRIACNVKPGGSEEYRIARELLTAALKMLDSGEA
jgi:hypothetical protein